MKRFAFAAVVLSVIAFGAWAPAVAQETKLEVAAGVSYPLLSRKFDIDPGVAWRAKVGVRATPNLTVGVLGEHFSGRSNIHGHLNGPVEINLYGAHGSLVINGEQDFQLIAFLTIGTGDLFFDNPVPPASVADPANSTKIKLWTELGGGAQFGLSKHWVLRIQVAGRRTAPKDPSWVLPNVRYSLVPSAEIAIRF